MAALVVSAIAALAAFAGPMGCSLIVTDNLPPYICIPDAEQACAPGYVCRANGAGTQNVCQLVCRTDHDCLTGSTCDPRGWCVTVDDGSAGADGTLVPDASTMDATLDLAPDVARMDATLDSPPDSPLDSPLDRVTADREAATGETGAGDAEAGPADGAAPCTGVGCRCSMNDECPTGYACVNKQAVTSNIWDAFTDAGGSGTGFCAEPCCTSSDCDMNDGGVGATVCFATGSGGNYCVPPAWLEDRGVIGPSSNPGGAACAAGGTACRSGLCVSGICEDTCCSNYAMNECATGSVCRFGPFPGSGFDTHEAAHCVASSGPPGNTGNMQCNMNSDCRSNLCIINPDGGGFGGPTGNCRDACRVPDECAGTGGIRSPADSCEYVQPFSPGTDIATVCVPVQQGGGGLIRGDAGSGAPCMSTADCARGYCAAGHCLVVCYVDVAGSSGDCFAGERCRPQPLVVVDGGATYSVLACGTP